MKIYTAYISHKYDGDTQLGLAFDMDDAKLIAEAHMGQDDLDEFDVWPGHVGWTNYTKPNYTYVIEQVDVLMPAPNDTVTANLLRVGGRLNDERWPK